MPFKKGGKPWNTGLTKETSEALRKSSEKMAITKKGVPSTKKGKHYESQQRENHWNWSGGRIKSQAGYIKVLVRGHHRADKYGYVREHILVAEKVMGRKLQEGEVVHHKNGIKDDNRPSNLITLKDKRHRSLHMKEIRKRITATKV